LVVDEFLYLRYTHFRWIALLGVFSDRVGISSHLLLQKIQLCSNMLVRDIVTSDKPIPLEPKVRVM
jgi:hypothetical protein